VAMFFVVTIYTTTILILLSICYIDNREFPGTDDYPPGPFGYLLSIYSEPLNVVASIMFLLNTLLADGLLVSSGPSRLCEFLTSSLALSLLRYLFHEPLGHRLPMPTLPCLLGYVFETSVG
jgi:RsiW-degrading membrane proteinase PrsW (M82 family)